MDPKPLRKLEIKKIYSSLHGALFMQSQRDYVPDWMSISGWSLGVSGSGKWRGISIKILWNDTRGRLIGLDGYNIPPLLLPTFWQEEHWTAGLEGVLKMTILEEARLWEKTVAQKIALGASWDKIRP